MRDIFVIFFQTKGASPVPNTPYHHQNLQQSLIETGIEYINQYGYEQFSLRKVAAACGVSHTAPYRHFKDKDDLLKAMQDHVEESFTQILEEALTKTKENAQSMISFGKAYVEFFVKHPTYYTFIFSRDSIYVKLQITDTELPSNFTPYNIFYAQAMKHFSAHDLPKEQYLTGLVSMWSAVHGLAGLATMNSIDYQGNWGALTEKVLRGINSHG